MHTPLSADGRTTRKFKRLIISCLALAAPERSSPCFLGRSWMRRAAAPELFVRRGRVPTRTYRRSQPNYYSPAFCSRCLRSRFARGRRERPPAGAQTFTGLTDKRKPESEALSTVSVCASPLPKPSCCGEGRCPERAVPGTPMPRTGLVTCHPAPTKRAIPEM